MHRFEDPADGEVYLYTQFETADAKRVFACFDQPDLKATYDMKVITPDHWRLITNGATTTKKDAGEANGEGAVAVHTAKVDYPLSTYLIAFMAGPYVEVTDKWTGTITSHPETPDHATEETITIPLGLYCRRTLADHMDSERLFLETKQGFDFYAKRFGVPYPFHKYDQIFCPEYNMGAMENAGAVTIREDYVFRSATTEYLYERRNDTILHEMAHMWFGDLVTMQWWNDLWLNESFATWTATQAQTEVSQYSDAWTTFASVEKAWAYAQDQLPSTHPVTTDASDLETVEQNFDGITYAKGASILKQLAAYVGLEPFLAGVRLHFARHEYGNATFDDLLGALTESSGRDLSGWADMWLKTTGMNTLSVDFTVDDDGNFADIAVVQSGAQPGKGELRDHRAGVGVYALDGGRLVRTAYAELDVKGERTEVTELVGKSAGDLILPNDQDLAYALIELDDKSAQTVVDHIGDIEDPMARALCFSAMWQGVRGGTVRGRDFVALVGRGLPTESHTGIVQQLVRQVVSTATNYCDPTWLDEQGWQQLTSLLLDAARAGQPGGDTQLAAVQQLVKVRPTTETVAIARAILADDVDSVQLPGLATDAEMTWLAIKLLASAAGSDLDGAPSLDEIEQLIAEQSQKDRSSLGDQAATMARALVPTAENKQRVWEACTTEAAKDSTNREILALLDGFITPGRIDLAEGYRESFFERAEDLWSLLGGEMALRVLSQAYPSWDISLPAREQASELIAKEELPGGLRRLLAEGHDAQERFARAQLFDAQ